MAIFIKSANGSAISGNNITIIYSYCYLLLLTSAPIKLKKGVKIPTN